jgi:hypothetical protein
MLGRHTLHSLHRELSDLGLRSGMVLMVHSSLGQVGWTVGCPATVIRALLEVLGTAGTLVMPAESPYVSDPSTWNDPHVPPQWYETIRENLPVFDPLTTPTTMGAIPEAFRTFPGTERSWHPKSPSAFRSRNPRPRRPLSTDPGDRHSTLTRRWRTAAPEQVKFAPYLPPARPGSVQRKDGPKANGKNVELKTG